MTLLSCFRQSWVYPDPRHSLLTGNTETEHFPIYSPSSKIPCRLFGFSLLFLLLCEITHFRIFRYMWYIYLYLYIWNIWRCVCIYTEYLFAKSLQSCPTLWDPVDCSLPASSVHGILQARILEWVAMPSFRESYRPRDWTHVSCISCIGRWLLYHPGSPHTYFNGGQYFALQNFHPEIMPSQVTLIGGLYSSTTWFCAIPGTCLLSGPYVTLLCLLCWHEIAVPRQFLPSGFQTVLDNVRHEKETGGRSRERPAYSWVTLLLGASRAVTVISWLQFPLDCPLGFQVLPGNSELWTLPPPVCPSPGKGFHCY